MRGIEREDRRDVGIAFATILGVLASHSMLETARDTLFLSALPPSRLPWVYIAIAGLTYVVVRVDEQNLIRAPKRRTLAGLIQLAAVVTAGFWLWSGRGGSVILYAFYVWTGLVATITVSQFWVLLGGRFDVARAKRAFALIGAGALIGATVGALFAGALLEVLAPRHLLLVAAGILGLTGMAPMLLSPRIDKLPAARRRRAVARRSGEPAFGQHPYVRRLLFFVLATTIAITAADLTFKTVVAERLAPSELGPFFATFYALLNGLALVVQLVFASRLVRALGVNRALLVLPALLLTAAGAYAASGLFLLVLAMKSFDGSLRHSLNRTATELVYLPLPPQLRARAKTLIDGAASRGGQALAAVGVLAAMAAGAGPFHLAVAVVVAAALWMIAVVALRAPYLELFREQLRQGVIATRVEVPDLDVNSLEALLTSLNSPDEEMVITALDLIERSRRTKVIPALILYHPSKDVVLRALAIFGASGRDDFVPIARRLLHSIDPDIRAAALRVCTAVEPDEEILEASLDDPNPDVRATAIVGLIAAGVRSRGEIEEQIAAIIDGDAVESRVALARAIRESGTGDFDWALRRLARKEGEPELAAEVAWTVAARPTPTFVPALLRMLESRKTRDAARAALLAIGYPALDVLDDALGDTSLSPTLRRHIPRTISRFPQARAAAVLQAHLARERDGRVSFKILRGLGRMVANDPMLPIDRELVGAVAARTMRRAITLLDWRIAVRRAASNGEDDGVAMLAALLEEKERHAIMRVFRILGLLEPREDFRILYVSIFGGDRASRASSLEILEYVVEPELRAALLALLRDAPDEARLTACAAFYAPEPGTYVDKLRQMLADDVDAIRAIAAHVVADLHVDELRPELERLESDEARPIHDVLTAALRRLNAEPAHA